MKLLRLTKLVSLIAVILFTHLSLAETTQPKVIKHITVINNSEMSLIPTGAGLNEGCIGGSLPPFFDPVQPHTIRDVSLIFIQYLPSCTFDVLPQPNIITYLQSCHSVKSNDTVTYSGKDFLSLRCDVSNSD